MVEVLAAYSLSEILAILVAVALGIKGVISFYDWAVARLKQKFGKETHAEFHKEQLEQRLALGNLKMKDLEETDKTLDTKIQNLKTETDNKKWDCLIFSRRKSSLLSALAEWKTL